MCVVDLLFGFDVRALYDRLPARDLILLMGSKRLGTLALGRRKLLADVGETLCGCGVGKSFADGCVQFRIDLCGAAARDPNGVPVNEVEAG